MVDSVKIACGTDDGINFANEHFGSAKFYLLFELNLNNGSIKEAGKILNTSIEEKEHGDPKKAASVSEMLKDVQVLVGFVMGPNIVRMRKRFVPIVSREKNIRRSLERVSKLADEIKAELNKKGDKKVFILDK